MVYNKNVVAFVNDGVVRVVDVTTTASQSLRSFDEHFACVTFTVANTDSGSLRAKLGSVPSTCLLSY